MRTAQILYSGLGGHGGVAFGLIGGDRGRKWEWALGFLGTEPLLPAYAERCDRERIACRYVRAVAGAPWHAWPRIYRWLVETRPDAIVLHSPTAVLPCALYARRYRAALAVVEHQQNKLKRRGDWLASRVAMRLAHRLVVLTDDYAAALSQGLGRAYRPAKVRVIPNGLDLDLFKPASERAPGPIRIGMAARFTSIKRFDLLIAAMAELRARHPEHDVCLSLAGGGETWEATRQAAAAANLEDRVRFEGMLAETELADWYRSLDIYAHASAGETLSLSLLQAMATALPIVASDVAGIDGLLARFDPGPARLVAESEAAAFAAAIADFAARLPEVKAAAAALRRDCAERYGNWTMFARYKALFEELAAERGGAAIRRG